MKKEFEEIVKLTRQIGWDTTIDKNKTENYSVFTFTLIKPYQLDFSFSVEADSVFSLLDNAVHYLSAYDVSEETYFHLDEQGHGKKGYPYDMEDVLKIFKYREDEISKLVEHLTNNYEEEK